MNSEVELVIARGFEQAVRSGILMGLRHCIAVCNEAPAPEAAAKIEAHMQETEAAWAACDAKVEGYEQTEQRTDRDPKVDRVG